MRRFLPWACSVALVTTVSCSSEDTSSTLPAGSDYREEVVTVASSNGTLWLEVHTNTDLNAGRAALPWEDRAYRENRPRSILHEGFGIE